MVRQVPLGSLATCVGPNPAIQDELDRRAAFNRGSDYAGEVILRNRAVAAFARQVEIRIEQPVAVSAPRRPEIENWNRNADPLSARHVIAVSRADFGRDVSRDAGCHYQEVELLLAKLRSCVEFAVPLS